MTTVSHWWRDHGSIPARAPLPGDLDVDVAIVGAGYTGLWTAYYLAERRPELRIAVLERRFAGFGASGRNGGWLTNSVTGGRERYGRDGGIRQQRAMNDTVDEVIRVATAEGIDADIRKGGELTVARSAAQLARLDTLFTAESAWPGTDVERWDAARTAEHVRVAGTLGAVWHPHCARIHPVKLLAGLAAAVERRGVTIFEDTAVAEILPGRAVTDRGVVRASAVIRATEGFTTDLRGEHRTWLPMNSSMIVTAPLPEAAWERIGWTDAATLGDAAHVYMYAQRTADGRIAFGGRGVPYRYGSRIDTDGATPGRTVASLTELLRRFFPAASDVPVEDAWSGVLGVPRDWAATVGFDRAAGVGWAGGYVGTGVATTNLAGRTLADLVLGEDSDLVSLPWVGHRARRWEPEPLRWLAVHGIYGAYRFADAREDRGGGTSPVARIADLIAGR
ncbi:FAD-dependent oxidoreductase [Microbacterium sp. NPDC079995]|uniref:NAD(P)/FAD-dependent oxidoreductase n=1 Tax=unclassified Microbacterium TaxID=2609290 RepID=UPI00345007B6